jgi:hypothetical protein
VVGVQLKCPLASLVAVHTVVPSTLTVTTTPAAAVPVKVGVGLVVVEPETGVVMTGVPDETVKFVGLELALPPGVLASTVAACAPGASGVVASHAK